MHAGSTLKIPCCGAALAGVLICAVVGGGCGPRVTMVPVRGRVTVDGKPLGAGSVMFQPQAGPAARGQINADGSFELGTHHPGDGVRAGPAAVRVTSVAAVKAVAGEEAPSGRSMIPMRYADFTTSGITVTVTPGMEPVEIELSSK